MSRENPEFPREGDQLFREGGEDTRGVAFVRYPWEDAAEWQRYVEGYRAAAEAAVSRALGDKAERDTLVYPIVFLYRHHFELALKTIIVIGSKMFDLSLELPMKHGLPRLWDKAREVLDRWGNKEDPVLATAGKQLLELDGFDSRSSSFRYPIDTNRAPSNPRLRTLDFKHFAEVAGRLSYFLSCCVEGLSAELGEVEDCAANFARIASDP